MWLHFCWVMVCPVTTCRPTQTQGHTHHDTVESVWLGSRSTSKEEEGKPPKRDWCLCPYRCPSSSSLSPSVYPSPALSVSSPSRSICRHHHSHLLLTYLFHCSPFTPHFMQSRIVSYEITQNKYQFIISWEFPLTARTNLMTSWCFNICACCINRVCIFVKPHVWGTYRWGDM